MRKTIFTLALLISAMWAYGQSGFNYKILLSQGTNVLANQNVTLRLTLKDGGTTVYRETQSTTTDANGIASVTIGTGTVVSGNFSNIDWTHAISLQTEVSTNGGSSYTDFGTTPFEYVPYAQMSESAKKLELTTTPVSVTQSGSGTRTAHLEYNNLHLSDRESGTAGNDWYVGMNSSNDFYISNDASYEFKIFDATHLARFYHDVQIDGDLQNNGKLKGQDSGDADMKAYVYGSVNSSASIESNRSSSGFSISHPGTGHYQVTLTNYSGGDYMAIVVKSHTAGARFISVSQANGHFDVYVHDSSGTAIDGGFNFVVFKK